MSDPLLKISTALAVYPGAPIHVSLHRQGVIGESSIAGLKKPAHLKSHSFFATLFTTIPLY
jgi:hypothetical protein